MYKYKSFSLSNNPLLFLLHREVLESLNGAVDRVVSTELDASVDSKKNSRVGRFSFLYHMPFLNKHMHTRWRAHTASLNTHTHAHTFAPSHISTHMYTPFTYLLPQDFPQRHDTLFLSVSAPSWKYDERQIEVVKWDKCSSGGAVLRAVRGEIFRKDARGCGGGGGGGEGRRERSPVLSVGQLVGLSEARGWRRLMCPSPCGLCSPGTGTWSCVGRPDWGGC